MTPMPSRKHLRNLHRTAVYVLGAFVALLAVTAGARTAAPTTDVITVDRIEEFAPQWRPLFKGIDFTAGRKQNDPPQAAYALRIDLHEEGIAFLATPSNGEEPAETDGRKTSTFLEEFKCQAAVNASPFVPVSGGEGSPKDIRGISVSRGDLYSAPDKNLGALLLDKDNRARIVTPPFDTQDAYNAVGGFAMLLEEGANVGTDNVRHPRTAVGLAKDGRYLYLLAIDGRQGRYSEGATTSETAQWMLRLGAWTALNLDGGGSTSMVVADDDGRALMLNKPIHNNIPGVERVNGNHLGIFAKPLE